MPKSQTEVLDPTALSDGDLAARIAAAAGTRAPREEAELCRRFARRIRLYGKRHLGSDDAALDLVQRVLVITLEKLRAGEVREPERIASFVLGTARLVCLEVRRATGRAQSLDDDDPGVLEATARVPDPIASDKLAASLRELPPREQSVLTLTYYGEHTTEDIARALGLSPGNVRVIRHRAVARLRQALGLDERGGLP